MARGKQTCKILKEIRRKIAVANDIVLATSECRYKGDCLGTCPKCEAEVRYLEQQLRKRQLAGKLVNLAGISAGAIAMLAPLAAQSQAPDTSFDKEDITTQVMSDTIIVKGVVLDGDTLRHGSASREPMVGASIKNLRTGKTTSTDIDGNFQIDACRGDSLEILYVGCLNQSVVISDNNAQLEIMLHNDDSIFMGEVITVNPQNTIDLSIIDEDKKPLPFDNVTIERVYIDKYGEEDSDELYPIWIEEKGVLRIYWNDEPGLMDEDDNPLKEASLRIEATGYDDPVTIKVKYPKRNTKKTIKFKHKKE